MREKPPQMEWGKRLKLEKINREIIKLEEIVAKKTEVVKKMEREHRASVRQDTDDLVILQQIWAEDKLKEPIAEIRKRLDALREEKESLTNS
ncbi:MAG: hypothetical protein NTW66_01460 [Candidatus Magasanikbacteria bacterium]|nr:hypothetical protein [Candidatus Magasanikbacteria bacterium]